MDQPQKESLPEDMNEIKKFCSGCKTTQTPLWRAGPSGPKSLCNACGIRYKKKSNAIMRLNKGVKKHRGISSASSHISTNTTTAAATSDTASSIAAARRGDLSEDLRERLVALGKEVVILQRQRSPVRRKRQRSVKRKLGEEEEQAAALLMSLSSGVVFA